MQQSSKKIKAVNLNDSEEEIEEGEGSMSEESDDFVCVPLSNIDKHAMFNNKEQLIKMSLMMSEVSQKNFDSNLNKQNALASDRNNQDQFVS